MFVYGTLLCEKKRELLEINLKATPIRARLMGYKRVRLTGVAYPVAIEAGSSDYIDGEIHTVDRKTQKILDWYEDVKNGLYKRIPCACSVDDAEIHAQVYVQGPQIQSH